MKSKILDYSIITDSLIVGKTPHNKDYKKLRNIGVETLINMRLEWPPLHMGQNITNEIWVPTIDSKYYPLNFNRIKYTAQKISKTMGRDSKVYVYCREGRHRSVLMASLIMLNYGYELKLVKKLILSQRAVADERAIDIAYERLFKS